MTEDECRQFEEARQHVHESVEAIQELFSAHMALVRVPLEHPDYCSIEAEVFKQSLADCEEYLAETFRRDVGEFSYSESFLKKECVEPETRLGNLDLSHLTELDHRMRAKEDILFPNETWIRRLEQLYERNLAHYKPMDVSKGTERESPFSGMCANESPVNWPNGAPLPSRF